MVHHTDDIKLIQLVGQTVRLDQQNVAKTPEALVRFMQSRECEDSGALTSLKFSGLMVRDMLGHDFQSGQMITSEPLTTEKEV